MLLLKKSLRKEKTSMIGMGTIVNTIAVIAGGFGGFLFGKLLNDRIQETINMANGVSVLFVGIAGALKYMLVIHEGALDTSGTMMVILSLTVGGFVGELINIEHGFERFGAWLKIKSGNGDDNQFIDGFVTASLTVCIGAMAIVGAIQDGMTGDWSILAAKSVLDFIIIMVMTCSLGKGCVFSAIPIFVFEGSITFLATFLKPIMTEAALNNLSLVGSILIFCVGMNLVWGKKVRVANFLPALIIAVMWTFF